MKVSKALGILLLAVLLVSLPCHAATGNQGYAVYRDGVLGGLNWHTGIMVEPNSSNYGSAISHAPGTGSKTGYTSYNGFVNGNKYKGLFRPFKTMSTHERDLVVSTARYIAQKGIPYISTKMMIGNQNNGRDRFYPNDILNLRCDGVVEYCYEYNGIKVCGNDSCWDISKNSKAEIDMHSGLYRAFDPKEQAQQYMYQIGQFNEKP